MLIKTYYSIPYTHINKIVYELPRHEEVNKFTKMSLVFKNGGWNVVADVYPRLKSEVTSALREDKDRVIHIREVNGPVS